MNNEIKTSTVRLENVATEKEKMPFVQRFDLFEKMLTQFGWSTIASTLSMVLQEKANSEPNKARHLKLSQKLQKLINALDDEPLKRTNATAK